MKAAGLVVGILGLIVATLQLVHDAYGLGVAPLSAAREAYRDIFGEINGVSPDLPESEEIVDAAETLDEAMEVMKAEFFDTSAPTTPSNLRITNQDKCSVTLEWDASTDDEGVTAYRVYRNDSGVPIGRVDGATTTFEVILEGDSETFTVIATDGSNDSQRSNEINASC